MEQKNNKINSLSFEEAWSFSSEEQHLHPMEVENKNEYYSDLWDIVNSWSGRADVIYSNSFFNEAKNLITNAIVLFEKGYFDCAFYSLRQSIEVSLTIAFLADDDNSINQIEMHKKWMNKEKFPQQQRMKEDLQKRNLNFSDIKSKMTIFFDQLKNQQIILNKYVHKQGYDTFYNHKSKEELDKLKSDFISSLELSISAIAIYRLVLDPLPLLLIDETIYQKSGDLLTEPFSEDFINKYLVNYIEQYKETQVYIEYYNHFNSQETFLPSVLDIVKNKYVNREKIEEINSQMNLLTIYDRLAIAYFSISPKISQIHMGALGIIWYFSDIKSNRLNLNFNSEYLLNIKESSCQINQSLDNIYCTYFNVISQDIYLEHNEIFSEAEIEALKLFQTVFEDKFVKDNEILEKMFKDFLEGSE